MRITRLSFTLLLLALIPLESSSRDGPAIWDSRCEECHGDPALFANKYLWNIEGKLQGRHHIDNLDLFMHNHYTPDHEIDAINEMLLADANSAQRYTDECNECHGDAREFVDNSLWITKTDVTGLETGREIGEYLPTHQELGPEDVIYYRRLFARIAGKPIH